MLTNFQKGLPQGSLKLFRCAIDCARTLKIPIYLVGGPVRDILLDRVGNDLDLVVEGQTRDVAALISDRLRADVVHHSKFGTATVTLGKHRLDLTTARKESYAHPGALPDISKGSLDDDLRRRDFTINAMAIELEVEPAVLIDPCNGRQDLEKGKINALHHLSFQDDPTRILRAIKFEQRLGFELGQSTEKWLRSSLTNGALKSISSFRIQRELNMMFHEHTAKQSIIRAGTLGFWKALFRPLDNTSWINLLPERDAQHQDTRFISAISYNLDYTDSEEFIRRLDMPKNWKRSVRDIILLKDEEHALKLEELPNSRIYEIFNDLDAEALAVFADYNASNLVRSRVHEYLETWRHVRPFLTGNDLITLGIPSGPQIKEMIEILRSAHINGRVMNRQDEADLVVAHLKNIGG